MNNMNSHEATVTALAHATELVGELHDLIENETALIRAGKLRAATGLAASKSELAAQLYACRERLKPHANALPQAAPADYAALNAAQQKLHVALKNNMTVLATAHAVSEGIVRRLSGDLSRKAAPQVYGASGRTTLPRTRQAQPLALSRIL